MKPYKVGDRVSIYSGYTPESRIGNGTVTAVNCGLPPYSSMTVRVDGASRDLYVGDYAGSPRVAPASE